jgi:cellulose synthase/poly-beta-1,6-N-acetylglucosamine synthase-like glycosyltransferase
MLYLFFRRKQKNLLEEKEYIEGFYNHYKMEDLPKVTTQIPIYNEYNVAVRVIRAVATMDYPKGKHQIQVLDDSTDETCELIDNEVCTLKSKGIDISVVRRKQRTGFKAGALTNGLKEAAGDLIAVFDADFIPQKDFLLRMVPLFIRNDKLGIAQARWGHTNNNQSLLTRIQAIGIDGHFMIEQPARAWNGLFMNFNGTAGMFRKKAIKDAGGWQEDTLTEDMDLSYRIQLKGWKACYSLATVAPAELPENIHAFKSQQFRWAKGSIQTALKLMGQVVKSKRSNFVKIQAFMHLTHYCVHPLMLFVSILALPVLLTFPIKLEPWAFAVFALLLCVSMTGPSALYTGSQVSLGPGWLKRIMYLPFLICLGVGLALSNTRAVMEAFIGKQSPFVRTPKKGAQEHINYHRRKSLSLSFEFILGCYCFVAFIFYIIQQKYLIGPFLAIYSIGYTYIAVLGFLHSARNTNKDRVYRNALTAICGFFLVVLCFWMGNSGSIGSQFPVFLLLYTGLWGLALIFLVSLNKRTGRIRTEVWIFIVAVLCRMALFNLPASGDMNRYLWEGRMLNHAVNPYAEAPDAPALQHLRDDVWKGINHPDMTACYPPGSLGLFSQLVKVSYRPSLFKSIFVGFDLATLIVVFFLLRKKKKDARMAVLYGLNPVVLVSFAGQAHLDSLMIFFMSAAVLAWYTRRWILMFVLLALSVQSKQIAFLLLPFIIKRENLRYLWVFALCVLVPFIPFMDHSIMDPFRSLITFSISMAHNGSIHGLLRLLTGSVSTATIICMLLFAVLYYSAFRQKSRDPLLMGLYILGAFLLLSPTVHFWYLCWLIPFLCFFPRWSWIVLCLTIGLYFVADWMLLNYGVWRQPIGMQVVQWLPMYAVLLYEIRKTLKHRSIKLDTTAPRTASIIIPVLNAEKHIDECLRSIGGLTPAPQEVIVVDGGSVDRTVEKALRHNVRVTTSSRGRGIQISRGLREVCGDVTVVVHGDTCLEPDTLGIILKTCSQQPDVIGGAVGQRFKESSFSLTLIEILNDFRAAFLGISFGDQVQFFRTQAARRYDLIPRIPLMEDVELSLRLGRIGRRVYLWGGAVVAGYKWEAGFAKRFLKVIYLLSVFFMRKMTRQMKTDDLYKKYYNEEIRSQHTSHAADAS